MRDMSASEAELAELAEEEERRKKRAPWGVIALVLLTGLALVRNGSGEFDEGPPQPASAAAPDHRVPDGLFAGAAQPLPHALPERVRIPGIQVDAPVIPVGQWGAQQLLPAYTAKPHPFPRKTVRMKVGDPVDLSDLLGQEPTTKLVAEATHRIMDAIVDLVAEVRGEPRPAELFDPRKAGVRSTGNPNKKPKK